MGTDKRQRQKENRQARLEAERAAAARSQRRRRLVMAVGVAAVVFAVLAFMARNAGDDETTDVAADDTTTTTATTEETPPTTAAPSFPVDPADQPEVELPEEIPDELVVEDLEEGDGEVVEAGDTVTAHYVGVLAENGEEFDSSWERGDAATFSLDQVIPGWTEGIPGMKVGGRRKLIIPGDLAYGASPPPGSNIPPDAALVFVVDLEAVS